MVVDHLPTDKLPYLKLTISTDTKVFVAEDEMKYSNSLKWFTDLVQFQITLISFEKRTIAT